MAAEHTEEGTLAPGETHAEGGLPQMNVDTFASQIFWLVVTFTILLVVLSRVLLPNIRAGLESRKSQIESDLGLAEELRQQAAESLEKYETSLASAHSSALTLVEESRNKVINVMEAQKLEAETKEKTAMEAAEKRIKDARQSAAMHVRQTASKATVDIVERLIGERVSEADVKKVVGAGS
jgi:F-type H+-transporting ATPase subunit b